MQAAGTQAGDGFNKGFSTTFDKSLNDLTKKFANDLARKGDLAGERLGETLTKRIRASFQGLQSEIADVISDPDAFRSFAEDFATPSKAVDQLTRDLKQLTTQFNDVSDGAGGTRREFVLTKEELNEILPILRQYARELTRTLAAEEKIKKASEDLDANWRRLTRTIGDTSAFRKASEEIGSTSQLFDRLRAEIVDTSQAMGLSRGDTEEYIDRLERTRDAVDAQIESQKKHTLEVEKNASALDKLGKIGELSLKKLNRSWSRMDSTVRLVTTLILGAGDQVAVLGSAAGAGIVGIGGLLAQTVSGVAAGVVVLTRLFEDLEEAPASFRPIIAEFQELRDQINATNDVIAAGAFSQLEGVFPQIASNVEALNPVLFELGEAVGRVFANFAEGTAEGTRGFDALQELIVLSSQNFEDIADAAGTWGVALVQAFNEANPLVRDLIRWIDELGEQFSDFTQSADFEVWLGNAEKVFDKFEDLLSAVGNALDDLASPEAVTRTTDLLDSLTRLTPALGKILNIFGSLDPFGIALSALADFGEALDPILDPLADVAEALRGLLIPAIDGLIEPLVAVTKVAGPFIQAIAEVLEAVPPGAVQSLAFLGTTLLLLKGVDSAWTGLRALPNLLTTVNDSINNFVGNTVAARGGSFRLAQSLSTVTKAAGIAGIAAAALSVTFKSLADAGVDWTNAMHGVDDAVTAAVTSDTNLVDSLNKIGRAFEVTEDSAKRALDAIGSGNVLGSVGQDVLGLRDGLAQLDKELGTIPLDNAVMKFQEWGDQLGLNDEQMQTLLNELPTLKNAIEDQLAATGEAATATDVLNFAMQESVSANDAAADAAKENADALAQIEGKAFDTGESIDDLADKIRNFGSATLDTRAANRQFQESYDDLTESIEKNGTSLKVGTEEGRANQAAIDDLAKSTLDLAAATFEQTGSADEAADAVQRGRDALIRQLEQFGITGQAAEEYADELGLIPENIETIVELDDEAARRSIDKFIADFDGSTVDIKVGLTGATIVGNPSLGFNRALGGAIYGPGTGTSDTAGLFALSRGEHVLTAKDVAAMGGQEAVYAFRQLLHGGGGTPTASPMGAASGGGVTTAGAGMFGPGSIIITDTRDPYVAAVRVVDNIAELVGL